MLLNEIVEVTRGRKVAPGTVGIVVWEGKKYNRFEQRDEQKACLLVVDPVDNGPVFAEKVWIKSEYLTPIQAPVEIVERAMAVKEQNDRHFGGAKREMRYAPKGQEAEAAATRYPAKA
jgi:hypothetical protein